MDTLDRINKAILSYKENNNGSKTKEDTYTKLVRDFFSNLTEEQIIQFDKIIDLVGDIQKDDLIVAYNTGVDSANNNIDFSIPNYIFEEFIRYYRKDKSIIVLDNLKLLLWLANKNDRLTQTQIDFLLENYT